MTIEQRIAPHGSTDDWLSEEETAIQLRVAAVTLRGWRRIGKAPKHYRFGRLVRYRPEDVASWVEAQASE